ncbi:MAG: toxin-antitoxin system, antitoxin component, Xre family protein [Gammaproteobacteria bacterium RIFCSPLOWO2_02_FULL_61_13]|nr:MAG: toxin-antitoxin system, antitoxin component, Xre family protein [Gammaproteobacteria bacterium RIFCSPLOWO2_02_FULL_61_13]
MNVQDEKVLIEKLRSLPPQCQSEVEDFVDFLHSRSDDRRLVHAASAMSEATLRKLWDNEDDAEYDRL